MNSNNTIERRRDGLTLVEHIENNVERVPESGCWIWMKSIDTKGYGIRIFIKGREKRETPHRLSHELFKGPIAPDLEIDHLCRVPACCNPAHLEAVTRRVNQLRGTSPQAINAKKAICCRGHDPSNWKMNNKGWRVCRLCKEILVKACHKRKDERIRALQEKAK